MPTYTRAVFLNQPSSGGGSNTPDDGEDVVRIDFDHTSSPTLKITDLVNGDLIDKIEVKVTEVFNGANPTVVVNSPSGTVGSGTIELQYPDGHTFNRNREISTSEALNLTLSIGGSTQGAGYVFARIQRNT